MKVKKDFSTKDFCQLLIGLTLFVTSLRILWLLVQITFDVCDDGLNLKSVAVQVGESILEFFCLAMAVYAALTWTHALYWPAIFHSGAWLIYYTYFAIIREPYLFMPSLMYPWDECEEYANKFAISLKLGSSSLLYEENRRSTETCYQDIRIKSSPWFFAPFGLFLFYFIVLASFIVVKMFMEHPEYFEEQSDTEEIVKEAPLFYPISCGFFFLALILVVQYIVTPYFFDKFSQFEVFEISLWIVCIALLLFLDRSKWFLMPVIILSALKAVINWISAMSIFWFWNINHGLWEHNWVGCMNRLNYPMEADGSNFSTSGLSISAHDCFEALRGNTFADFLHHMLMGLLEYYTFLFFVLLFSGAMDAKSHTWKIAVAATALGMTVIVGNLFDVTNALEKNMYNFDLFDSTAAMICLSLGIYSIYAFDYIYCYPALIYSFIKLSKYGVKSLFLTPYIFYPTIMYPWDTCQGYLEAFENNTDIERFSATMKTTAECYGSIMEHSSGIFFVIPLFSLIIYSTLYMLFKDLKSTMKDGISTSTVLGEKEKYEHESFFDNCDEFGVVSAVIIFLFVVTKAVIVMFAFEKFNSDEKYELVAWILVYMLFAFSFKFNLLSIPIIIFSLLQFVSYFVQFIVAFYKMPRSDKLIEQHWNGCFEMLKSNVNGTFVASFGNDTTPIANCFEDIRGRTFIDVLHPMFIAILLVDAINFFAQFFMSYHTYKAARDARRRSTIPV